MTDVFMGGPCPQLPNPQQPAPQGPFAGLNQFSTPTGGTVVVTHPDGHEFPVRLKPNEVLTVGPGSTVRIR